MARELLFTFPGEYEKLTYCSFQSATTVILLFAVKYFLTFTFTVNPSKSWLTITTIRIQFKVGKAVAILTRSLLARRL